jgi:saccharopine dehydrogenase-like protein
VDGLDGAPLEADVTRVIVLGGQGQFGCAALEQLRILGISPIVAARGGMADIGVDADDPTSIRAAFSAGDLIIDAAGPFHKRSLALLEAAIEIGFDVIDINDNLGYAEQVLALERRIVGAGIRVLSSASSVSAVAAAIVRRSDLNAPTRVTGFLAPASRHTANRGSALSLIRTVGCPVRAWRGGRLQTLRGWGERRSFVMPHPVGPICGRLFESADAVWLPRVWPSLLDVEMYVDANTPGVNALLQLGARFPAFRRMLERHVDLGAWIARLIGSKAGGIGYEIEDAHGKATRFAVLSGKTGHITAVAPAVLAARAIVTGHLTATGLVLPDRHVEPSELVGYLGSSGIDVVDMP